MKKLLSLLALGALTYASQAERIVAVEYASNTSAQTISGTNKTTTGSTVGLKLGAKEEQMRLFLSYRYSKNEQYGGLELDFFTPDMGPLALYLGGVAGYGTVSDTSMPYYGAQAGTTLTFGGFGIDVGARLSVFNYDITTTNTLKDITSYYAALHYIY